jgi:hypothetical protein
MRILAYTYNAAMHCVECTRNAADIGLITREPPLKLETDMHGIALDLVDTEDNPVTAVFHHEDIDGEFCDDCHEPI